MSNVIDVRYFTKRITEDQERPQDRRFARWFYTCLGNMTLILDGDKDKADLYYSYSDMI